MEGEAEAGLELTEGKGSTEAANGSEAEAAARRRVRPAAWRSGEGEEKEEPRKRGEVARKEGRRTAEGDGTACAVKCCCATVGFTSGDECGMLRGVE